MPAPHVYFASFLQACVQTRLSKWIEWALGLIWASVRVLLFAYGIYTGRLGGRNTYPLWFVVWVNQLLICRALLEGPASFPPPPRPLPPAATATVGRVRARREKEVEEDDDYESDDFQEQTPVGHSAEEWEEEEREEELQRPRRRKVTARRE